MGETRYQLGFIGAGKLAGSVIRGLLLKKFCDPNRIFASEPNAALHRSLRDELGISIAENNLEVAALAEVIFLGVKPQALLPILRELGGTIENKLVVSLAAAVRIQQMEAVTPARIMRVITNTPSAIGRAATAFTAGTRTTAHDREQVGAIFAAIGIAIEVDDDQIDSVTALAGSGPAFVYAVIEALAEGAVRSGLDRDSALRLAAQTTLGAGELALTAGKTPDELIAMVVTPGGTTAAGLDIMQKRSTADGISAAVEAAAARGREMAKENQ
jgi:pyrroline-5-carboxylate reductase